MSEILHRITSYLLIALGIVHTSLTPVFMSRLSPGAMWFAGAGLAMVVLGFLNVCLRRDAGRDRVVRLLCHVANVVFTMFGGLTAFVINEPQGYFGLVLLSVLTVTSFTFVKRRSEE
ncbi:MAG: hypothetical protein H0V88_01130 [Pyrinomonadaceae bacterium]|nr:hypothetical protein [Pyrinomonadaceae bacterium]